MWDRIGDVWYELTGWGWFLAFHSFFSMPSLISSVLAATVWKNFSTAGFSLPLESGTSVHIWHWPSTLRFSCNFSMTFFTSFSNRGSVPLTLTTNLLQSLWSLSLAPLASKTCFSRLFQVSFGGFAAFWLEGAAEGAAAAELRGGREVSPFSKHSWLFPRTKEGFFWSSKWLVVYLSLWKIWVRQLGLWNSQYIYMEQKHMFQTTNQLICNNWYELFDNDEH